MASEKCVYTCLCVSFEVHLCVFKVCVSADGLDIAKMKSLFPKQLLTASPGSFLLYFHSHPRGKSDMGAVGLTGTDIFSNLSLHEVWVSHHRNGCLTAHPFSQAPLGFAPVLCCLNWASITNLFVVLTVEGKRAWSWNWPVCMVLWPQGP